MLRKCSASHKDSTTRKAIEKTLKFMSTNASSTLCRTTSHQDS